MNTLTPMTTRWLAGVLALGIALGVASTHAAAQAAPADAKGCALVLLHGKGGNAQSLGSFARRLDPPCAFKALDMPWSKRRDYDADYPSALRQIAAQVQAFRADGYRRVLVVGHSFGANAALAYMAEVGDADGVIALAPGHSPGWMYERGVGRAAVDRARELVAAGKADETLTMEDLNMGSRRSVRMSAGTLLSYFDPQGLGHMPATAARFKKPVPLLWVYGSGDPLSAAGQGFAFDRAPPHPSSQYLLVTADHYGTPDAAVGQALDWVRALPDK